MSSRPASGTNSLIFGARGLGALAEPDRAHLRQRADWLGQTLADGHHAGDGGGADGAEADQQHAELAACRGDVEWWSHNRPLYHEEMRMFLRAVERRREPLAVTMSGVRLGERALQIGVDDPGIVGALAAKTGMTGPGHGRRDGPDQRRTRARRRGGQWSTGRRPDCADGHAPLRRWLLRRGRHPQRERSARVVERRRARTRVRECRRVLRPGGRASSLEAGTPTGLRAILGVPKRDASYEAAGGTVGCPRDRRIPSRPQAWGPRRATGSSKD